MGGFAHHLRLEELLAHHRGKCMTPPIRRRDQRRGIKSRGWCIVQFAGSSPTFGLCVSPSPPCSRSSTRVVPGRSSCRPFGLPALRRGDSMISPVRLLWLAASAVGRRAGYTQRRKAWAVDLPSLFSLGFIYRSDKGLRCAGSADALCATLRAGSVQPGFLSPRTVHIGPAGVDPVD
ncbi:MAG: hypothetical protein XD72_2220 [Methanothrix harundinacea]|jgi:hypothetical protein|uniref:Uncharacterized protein n=1 Tax=Methanothrix harundinacea TaxID=301375 RepID=A0A101FS88_9EURY|nr:MAG: hypothetical protein XD72_2220 [Methanothrix harundinacea]